MRVSRISNSELQDAFTSAYQNIASTNDINEFEAACERSVDGAKVSVEVTIFGFAGTPNQTEFEDLEGVKKVIVPAINPNDESMAFALESVYTLNTNDYVAVYELAAKEDCCEACSDAVKVSKPKKTKKIEKAKRAKK